MTSHLGFALAGSFFTNFLIVILLAVLWSAASALIIVLLINSLRIVRTFKEELNEDLHILEHSIESKF